MKLAKYSRVALPEWIYLGGESITPAGATAQATLPSLATIFKISPESQDCYYAINGVFAGLASSGFVVAGRTDIEGPLGNLARLDVYCAAGGTVHITYYREG